MSTLVVGLTGGIGSGKSTVARLFAAHGIVVVDADQCSRTVVEPGKPALTEIFRHFGADILLENGELNRTKLRTLIFQNPAEKTWLESLLHPLIHAEITHQLASANSVYAMLESPLLVETAQQTLCNRILVVDAEEEQQIRRTMQRDNNSEALVRSIMGAQASREVRNQAADDIIHNHGNLADLEKQVDQLHAKYLELNKTTCKK